MKKTFLLFALLALGTSALHAENRLFATDVLQKGEFDFSIGIEQNHRTNSIQYADGISGTQKFDATSETASLRYGLGNNLHLGLAFANNSSWERRTDLNNGLSFHDSSNHGLTDPTLSLKYSVLNGKQNPLSLSALIEITPDTVRDNSGSKFMKLSGGWDFGKGLKAWTSFSTYLPNEHYYQRYQQVTVGANKAINENVTLVPQFYYRHYSENNIFNTNYQYGLGLEAQILVGRNSYFVPGLGFGRNSTTNRKDGWIQWNDHTGRLISMNLYHLF